MKTEDQVAIDIEQWKAQDIPLSDAVWNTALDCIGWAYVFGAWGEECTPANRKRRARDDHPTIVSKCQVLNGKKDSCLGCEWLPDGCRTRIFDCRGFTDWCLKQFGIDLQGEGATSQWNTSSNWAAKGKISEIPDDILVCLFVQEKGKMKHTGFGYKGSTCECSSGVQYFEKRKAKWTHWAIPSGIDGNMPDIRPTLRKGDKGEWVVLAQNDLMKLGYELPKYGADGSFGNETLKAVKAMQEANGLAVDGVIGQKSWAVLKTAEEQPEPQPTVLYTVTIPHLPKYQAEGLVNTYAGAYMTMEERG